MLRKDVCYLHMLSRKRKRRKGDRKKEKGKGRKGGRKKEKEGKATERRKRRKNRRWGVRKTEAMMVGR